LTAAQIFQDFLRIIHEITTTNDVYLIYLIDGQAFPIYHYCIEFTGLYYLKKNVL